MKLIIPIVIAGIILSSFAEAESTRQQPSTHGPSSLLSHAMRIEHDAAEDLRANPQSEGWFVDLDMYIPKDKEEYEALGKYVLLVFSAFSNDRGELPLVSIRAEGILLKCSQGRRFDLPAKSATAEAYGKYRADTLCVLPMSVERKTHTITLDFAKNHTGVQMGPIPFEEPDFLKGDHDPVSSPVPDPAVLQMILEREYPGFGFGVPI